MSLARGGVALQNSRLLSKGYSSQGVNIRVDIYIPHFDQTIGRRGIHGQRYTLLRVMRLGQFMSGKAFGDCILGAQAKSCTQGK